MAPLGERGRPTLAGYEITSLIGSGGFATVYRAVQLSLGREIALKILDLHLDDGAARSFRKEVAAISALSGHENVVVVHDAGMTDAGQPYLAMQLVEGGSWRQRLDVDGAVAPDLLARIGTEVADALAAAHQASILHRDVKPDNILISRSGRSLLADFGIAVLVEGSASTTGTIRGSLPYIAPEVVSGRRATTGSDVYSLGATLHALATGATTFARSGDHPAAIIHRVLTEVPPRLPIDLPTADLVAGMLAKDPADRPTIDEVRSQLARGGADTPLPGPAPPPPRDVVDDAAPVLSPDEPSDDAGAAPRRDPTPNLPTLETPPPQPLRRPSSAPDDARHADEVRSVRDANDPTTPAEEGPPAGEPGARGRRVRWALLGVGALLVLGLGVAAVMVAGLGEDDDGVAATVEGRDIAVDHLDAIVAAYVEGDPERFGELEAIRDDAVPPEETSVLLANLIAQVLQAELAEQRDLHPTEAERVEAETLVKESFVAGASASPGGSEPADPDARATSAAIYDALPPATQEWLVDLKASTLALTRDLSEGADVEAQAREVYDADPSAFEQHCLRSIIAEPADVEAIEDRLAAGEDFGAVSSDVTVDPALREANGELGPCLTVDQLGDAGLNDEIVTLVAGLEVGVASEPQDLGDGYVYFFEVQERTVPDFEEVAVDIEASLPDPGEAALQDLVAEERPDADIDVDPRFGSWDPETGRITPRPAATSTSSTTEG